MGSLDGVRRRRLAAEGAARVHDRADRLLQLRGGLRADGLRGPRDVRDPQARGQPAPSRQPRPQLREGPGDDQPDQGPRADPVPAAAQGRRAGQASGSGSAGTTCSTRSPSRCTRRSPPTARTTSCTSSAGPARTASPTGSSRRGGPTGTTRTPTSAPPAGAPATASGSGTDRPSPDYANAKFILLISAHLESGHYFNPHAQRIVEAQQRGGQDRRHGPAALEHRLDSRPLAADLAGHRGRAAARDREDPARRGALRPRVRAPLGQLEDLPAAPVARQRADVRELRRASCAASTRATRPSSPRPRAGVPAATVVADRPRDRRRRARLRLAHLARGRRRQPARLAGHPRADAAQRPHRAPSAPTAAHRPTPGTSSSPRPGRSRTANRAVERAQLAARVSARAQRDEHPLPALAARRAADPAGAVHARAQPDLDLSRRLLVDAGAARRGRSSGCTGR